MLTPTDTGARGILTIWVPDRRQKLHLGWPIRIHGRENELRVENSTLTVRHAKDVDVW